MTTHQTSRAPPHVLIPCAEADAGAASVHAAMDLVRGLGARFTLLTVRPRALVPAGAEEAFRGDVPTAVVSGIPAIEIPRYAETHRADLILLGPPAWEGQAEAPRRELVHAVVRRAEMPCLIVPRGQHRLRQMRVALDGSERGMRAVRVAWEFRALPEEGLSAIFVEPAPTTGGGMPPPEAFNRALEDRLTRALGPGTGVRVELRHGEVVTVVLDGLSADAGDVLVVGVRRGGPSAVTGATGIGRRLLSAAACAVLTVPL